jgi:hypothetical protein
MALRKTGAPEPILPTVAGPEQQGVEPFTPQGIDIAAARRVAEDEEYDPAAVIHEGVDGR